MGPEPRPGMQTYRRQNRVRNRIHFMTNLFFRPYEVGHAAHHRQAAPDVLLNLLRATSTIYFEMFSRPKLQNYFLLV